MDPSGNRHEANAGWSGFAGNANYSGTDPWEGWSGPVGNVLNFLILDDINTLRDSNSSGLARGLAIAGFIPVGKLIKGGKLILKLEDSSGKVIEKEFKLVDEALDYAKKCNCFTAGTKVQTDEGEKNIEDIEVGDKVLAKSDETGEVAYQEVTGLFNKQSTEIYSIHFGNEVIEATKEHPIWIDGKGWTEVKDLKVGDLLVTSDGRKIAIYKIEKEPRVTTVYNFSVEDYESYFVSNLGVWVHNCPANIEKILETQKKGKTQKLTNSQVKDLAKYLGYEEVKGEKSHGQLIFTNGKNYISQDVDSHNGGVWKMAKSIKDLKADKRMGTYDALLNYMKK
ncbi:hypothetical protein J25TS5_33400 [Paenibacillus faecis]|nr:polymorphic toxin-type HINT domain-containing protein [Paenibacillus faecis]GIO86408.1 hypothetical protein J25TS5_33400 [Paenibacillus faecis]